MSVTFSHSEAVQFPKVGIGGEFFIDIETVGRAPPSKEPQPARYQIVSVDGP